MNITRKMKQFQFKLEKGHFQVRFFMLNLSINLKIIKNKYTKSILKFFLLINKRAFDFHITWWKVTIHN